MRFMVENVSAGPNINRARRFLVECPEAGARLLNILKDAIVRHLVAVSYTHLTLPTITKV